MNRTLTASELASLSAEETVDVLGWDPDLFDAIPVYDADILDCVDDDGDDCGLSETLRRGEGCTSTEATRLIRFVTVAE